VIHISKKDDIKVFLLKAKKLISVGSYDFFDKREENMQTLVALGYNTHHMKQEILSLTPQNYFRGPTEDHDKDKYKGEYIWEFGKIIQGKAIYIKLKIRKHKGCDEVACMSFHEAKFEMTYPQKQT
jgi:hypothetical protein